MKYIRSLFWSACLVSVPLTAHDLGLTVSLPPFPPYFYADTGVDEMCRGVGVKILDILAQHAGIDFVVEDYPYARILKALRGGQLDTALIFKNSSLSEDVDFVGPIAKSRVLITTINDNQPKSYDDLQQLKGIAVIRKAKFHDDFDHDRGLRKIYVESYQQGLKMLKYGRVEAIIGSELGLTYGMKQLDIDVSVLQSGYYIGDKEWWLHLSKKSRYRDLRPLLQRAANDIYQHNLSIEIYRQQVKQGCYQE